MWLLIFVLSLVPAILAQAPQDGTLPVSVVEQVAVTGIPIEKKVSAPAPLVTISVTMNGANSTLTQLEGEDLFATARRWVAEHNLGGSEEVDSILRVLVNELRKGAGATDGLPPTPANGVNILAEVKVQGKLDGGEELGPMHMARWMETETAEDAAVGFVTRLGLPYAPNAQNLLNEFVRVANAKKNGGGSGTPPATPPGVPFHLGVSIPVTFQAGGASTLVYRYGQRVSTAVDAFLDQHNIVEGGSRSEAKVALTEAVIGKVNAVLRESAGEVGKGPLPTTTTRQDNVFANQPFVVPVAVGATAYDISIPQGGSIYKTAENFCRVHWDNVGPKMMGVAEKLVAKGGAVATGLESHVTVDTCRDVVFDLLVAFAGGVK